MGLPQAVAQRVHEAVERNVGDESTPGMAVLVACGEDVYAESAGSLEIGGSPVARDSLFRIASTTKPVTAAAALALVDEGLIELDEPVGRLLPELDEPRVLARPDGPLDDTVPARRAITVRDLLTFTNGFGLMLEMFATPEPWPVKAAADDRELVTFGPPEPTVQPDPDTWIARLGELPLMAQPGERWLYNTGASVLGVLLARAAGTSLEEVLRSRILEPLGMRDTSFSTERPERLPATYRPGPDGLSLWDPPRGQWSTPPTFGDGAAGLLSTVDDLLAFARMLLAEGAGVLSPESARAMCSDRLTPEQKARGGLGRDFFARKSWGFCLAVHDDGSFGWNGGLGTSWHVDPSRELTTIVLTQRMFETFEAPASHVEIQEAARTGVGEG